MSGVRVSRHSMEQQGGPEEEAPGEPRMHAPRPSGNGATGSLHNVPLFDDARVLPRTELQTRIVEPLMRREPSDGSRVTAVGIEGPHGSGKSVLAALVCRQTTVREHFPDGTRWGRGEINSAHTHCVCWGGGGRFAL